MKLVDDQGELRILGGWKPNDPKADGRTQEGRIIIADADGSNSESYSLRRRNWGLPVVEIDGTWWCKYNLRGSVKKFEDQISIQADPASDRELADYLNTCDEDELLRLMGDQYQGGTQQGLPLGYDGTAFQYEGMRSSGGNFAHWPPPSWPPMGIRFRTTTTTPFSVPTTISTSEESVPEAIRMQRDRRSPYGLSNGMSLFGDNITGTYRFMNFKQRQDTGFYTVSDTSGTPHPATFRPRCCCLRPTATVQTAG